MRFRNTALSSTPVLIRNQPGKIASLTLINVNTTPVYVKFFNAQIADVTVGTTVPRHVEMVPAGDGTTPGSVRLSSTGQPFDCFDPFETAITIAATTGLADIDTAAPATAIYVEIEHR